MQRESKKKNVIKSILILFLGIVFVFIGLYADLWSGVCCDKFDPVNVSDNDIGHIVSISLSNGCMNVGVGSDGTETVLASIGYDENVFFYGVVIPKSASKRFENAYKFPETSIEGKIVRNSEEETEQFKQAIRDYYDMQNPYLGEYALDDATIEFLCNRVSDYHIKIVENSTLRIVKSIMLGLGIITVFISVMFFLTKVCGLSGKKIIITLVSILLVIILLAFIIFGSKIRTVLTIRKVSDGCYQLTNKQDLKIDSLLEANTTSVEDFCKWYSDNHLFGYPVSIDKSNFGCSAFAAKSDEGDIIMGRNFDYPETDNVIIYNNPDDGYASIGVADLALIDVGNGDSVHPDSMLGRIEMIFAPYLICDGMNEAGLGISILQLDTEELHQDNGKPDLQIYAIIRVALERCGSVDEVVSFLQNYDIHSDNGVTSHFLIADATGRTVVVEWIENELVVNERNSATNSIVTPGKYYDIGADRRLPHIEETLTEKNNILSESEAAQLLSEVSGGDTEWSCVYNLSDFSMTIYNDIDFTNGYSFTVEDFT
ncbi:MAG: linear amide C-N hydrolase [Clostridia bacterium]|nr:linear amide C-N hydrolase [Clostridia bacterium]